MKKLILLVLLVIPIEVFSQKTGDDPGKIYESFLVAWNNGDLFGSREYLEQIMNGNFELSARHQILVYRNLGVAERSLGNIASALYYFTQVLNILDTTTLSFPRRKVDIYNNIGNVYLSSGDYFRAITYYNSGLDLLKAEHSDTQKELELESYLLLNKGEAYFRLKEYELSLDYLYKAIELYRSSDDILCSAYIYMAYNYDYLNRADSAIFYYLTAIEKIEESFGINFYRLPSVYSNYSLFLIRNRNYDEVIDHLNKALSICKLVYGEECTYTSNSYKNIAEYYLSICEYDSSALYISKAMDYYHYYDSIENESARFQPNRNRITVLISKARLYLDWGRSVDGMDIKNHLYQIGLEATESSLAVLNEMHNSYLSHQNRYYLLENKKELFQTGICIAEELFKTTNDEYYKELSYKYASLAKGYDIQSQIRKKQALYEKALPETLKDSIEYFGNRINTDLHRLNWDEQDDRLAENDSVANASLNEGLREYEKLMERAGAVSRVFSNMLSEYEVPDVKRLQRKLRPREAIIEYFLENKLVDGKKRMHVFLITKKDLKSFGCELDSALFADLESVQLVNVGNGLNASSRDSLKKTFVTALHELYTVLLGPFEQEIIEKDLIIIPDEDIHSLPFEILLTGRVDPGVSNYADLPYLLREHAISYAYASGFLFSDHDARGGVRCVKSIIPSYDSLEQYGLFPLVGARSESKALGQYFRCNAVYDKYYNKDEFFSLLEGRQIVHLGMHAQRDENNDESTRLIIPASKDSVYSCYAYEIEALDVEAPLIVLNACETAGGVFNSGDGVYNLARSFLLAGVPSAVHTLWEVEDRASAIIMEDFYKYLSRGYSKSKALQKAKIEYLESMPPAFTHPQYWAAFHLTGDVSALHQRRGIILIPVLLAMIPLFYFVRSRRFKSRRAGR